MDETVTESRDDVRARRVEFVAAVVLSIATVLTAWSAFEATKWGGVMSIEFSNANAARTFSVQASNRADTEAAVDVALFVEYAAAVAEQSDELADFLRERFRPEFVPAFEAWMALDPLENPDAPPSPFAMEEYVLTERVEAEELAEEADAAGQRARDANQRGDNYVLTTVLFASVLFFAGVSTKANRVNIQTGLVGLACVMLVVGAVILATFPVEI